MLAYIRCGKTSGTYAHSYLKTPDLINNQWFTRNNDEGDGFFCEVDIELTEELKIYLRYFGNKIGHKQMHTIPSFSNLPMKHQTVEESDC